MDIVAENTQVHDELRQGEAFEALVEKDIIFKKHFYIESYGCAMNFSDSEIIASILNQHGFGATKQPEYADIILVNTCSIREKAEATIRKRLTEFKKLKVQKPSLQVGVLGCMAERLKAKLLEEEKLVDIVVGPDAYRTLPSLIEEASSGQKAVNVLLSREETYADISPIRLNTNGVNAFVSIMRGCNNMCSFCVVPFTRGRERSRSVATIYDECVDLYKNGYKEVTLLGQNVDSYHFVNEADNTVTTFAQLLEKIAGISPWLRVRFSTSHPKDITDEVLHTMAKHQNICKYIHLPVQSGNSRVLQLMNRTYSREWYMAKIDKIYSIMPDCGISSDIITGFCTETDAEHIDTLTLMQYAKYHYSYMYYYSERPGTLAAKRYQDDIPEETKKRRLAEVIEVQNKLSQQSNAADVGKIFEVLIEGESKRSTDDWMGRTSQSKVMVFPKEQYNLAKGSYVMVQVLAYTQGTLLGKITTVVTEK